jgi:penicillin-binding protein activator
MKTGNIFAKTTVPITIAVALVLSMGFLASCGPKAFVKGQYEDPQKENLMDDQWSETDMQNTVKDMVASMTKHPVIAKAKTPPIVMVTALQNKTSEHIDTQSIMDMVRVELTNSGLVQFVDKEARGDVAEEYQYQNSGMVGEETKKGPGGQVGADFIVNGRIDSIVKEVGKEKTVYYKITLNLTNLKSNIIAWTDQKQMRKFFKKKSVGL